MTAERRSRRDGIRGRPGWMRERLLPSASWAWSSVRAAGGLASSVERGPEWRARGGSAARADEKVEGTARARTGRGQLELLWMGGRAKGSRYGGERGGKGERDGRQEGQEGRLDSTTVRPRPFWVRVQRASGRTLSGSSTALAPLRKAPPARAFVPAAICADARKRRDTNARSCSPDRRSAEDVRCWVSRVARRRNPGELDVTCLDRLHLRLQVVEPAPSRPGRATS